MPVSDGENKKAAKQWIDELNPKTVVDVGAGIGTYLTLAKQDGQHWTAIEVFEPYVLEYKLRELYDKVIVSDVMYIDQQYLESDLIIIGDCLEHLTYDDALIVIEKLKRNCKHLIISLPIIHIEQGSVYDNVFESHLYHWKFDELKEVLGDSVVKSVSGNVLGYFLVKGNK